MKLSRLRKFTILLVLFYIYFWGAHVSWSKDADLTVTATRIEEQGFYVPQSVSVVTADDIVEENFRTIAGALQEEPGILVQETNYGGGSPFIRGLTGKQTLILVDGIRFNNSTFRYGPNQYFNNIDPLIVDRVEIVRGPASVLYGSDAIGGVINVITKKRKDFSYAHDVDGELTARYGSADNSKVGRLEVSGNLHNLGFIGGVSYKDFGDLHGGRNTGLQEHTGYPEHDGDIKLQYNMPSSGEITAGYRRVHQTDVPRTDKFVYSSESYVFDPQIWNAFFVSFDRKNLFSQNSGIKATVSLNEEIEGLERQKFGSTTLRKYKDSVDSRGVSVQMNNLLMSSHLLTYGVDYYMDSVDSKRTDFNLTTGVGTNKAGNFPDDATYSLLGVYLQDDMTFSDRISAILGIRYSEARVKATLPSPYGKFEDRYSDVTGSAGVVYNISENIHGVVSIAQGFRAPNLDDTVVLEKITNEGIDVPSTGLDPEESVNYEIGLKMETPDSGGSIFYFYNDLTSLIERGPGVYNGQTYIDEDGDGVEDKGEAVRQKFNIGEAFIHGIEAEWMHKLTQAWTLNGNISWTYGKDTENNEPLSRIPPVLGFMGLKWEKPQGKYWGEYYTRFAGKQYRLSSRDKTDPRINPNGTGGWATHNLRGGIDFRKWGKLSVSVENIFDKDYRIHGSGINSAGINLIAGYVVEL